MAACAGSRRPAATKPVAGTPVTHLDAGLDAAPSSGVPVASLDALASRGPSDLPSMREALRSADATRPSVLPAGPSDACFRAVIAASAPIRAWFEDERHDVRGVELTGTSGMVPPRGPACARRGETLRLVIEPSAGITARAIVWRAP